MNRFTVAESLIGSLVTVMAPVSLAYIFCLWSGRTAPRVDHRTVASTWSLCSKLREAKIFIPIANLRSKSPNHIVPTTSIHPKTIAVRPTASSKTNPFWANPFYKAPKLPPGQACALVAVIMICFTVLVWLFIAWTRRSTAGEQSDEQPGEKPLRSTHNEALDPIERSQKNEATEAQSSSINRHLEQMKTSADKLKENCDTLDETHKQIETKFDTLSSLIEPLNERQEKESIPKNKKDESTTEEPEGREFLGFEKDDQQLGKIIKNFESQSQQVPFQFRFSETGSLGHDPMPGSSTTANYRTRSESPQFIFRAGRGI